MIIRAIRGHEKVCMVVVTPGCRKDASFGEVGISRDKAIPFSVEELHDTK